MGHWGTCPLEFANARKFCRSNARWLSLLDDFVTTNFGTRAPRARAPLEQNSGDATGSPNYKSRSRDVGRAPFDLLLLFWVYGPSGQYEHQI